jgi:tetratricopeptide (TPR) repeat protein
MRGTIWGVLLVLSVLCASPVLAQDQDLFDTKTAVAQREKGRELLHAKKYDDAIAALEDSVDVSPDDADAYYLLGYAYYMKGKSGDKESMEKARENFDQAYLLNPNFSPNKQLPTETIPATSASGSGEQSLSSAAPAVTQTPAPAAPAPAETTQTPPGAEAPAPAAETPPAPEPPAAQPAQ